MANPVTGQQGTNAVDVALTEKETQLAQRLLGDPTILPPIFKNWVTSWTEADVSLSLGQIQGWPDYQSSQDARDDSQDSLISSLQTSVSTNTSNITTLQGQVSSIQSTDTTQNSNISTLQGQMTTANTNISTLQSDDAAHAARLTALEAHTFPYLLATKTSSTTVTSTTAETTLATLTLPANKLPAPGLCEAHVHGSYTIGAGTQSPVFTVYFGGTLIATIPSAGVSSSVDTLAWDVTVRTMNTTDKSHQEHYTTALVPYNVSISLADGYAFPRRAATTISTSAAARDFVIKVANVGSDDTTICNAGWLLLVGST